MNRSNAMGNRKVYWFIGGDVMNEEIVFSPSSNRGSSLEPLSSSRARMLLRRNSESFMAENLLRRFFSLSLSLPD